MTILRHRLAGVSLSSESLLELSLSRGSLDRAAHGRKDPGLLAAVLADVDTKVLHLRGDRAQVEPSPGEPRDQGEGAAGIDGTDQLILHAPGATDGERLVLFLGRDVGGTAYVAVVEDHDPDAGEDWRTLRQVGADLSDHDAGLFTAALALANWHRGHTHCPRCGAPTVPSDAGWVRRCERDGSEHYPRTDMAVIMAVTDSDDRILLARGPGWHERGGSVLAGFVEPAEALEQAVAREVLEEVGITVTDVRYRGNQPWPFPASLMVGFTAHAEQTDLTPDPDEIAWAGWFTRAELGEQAASGALRLPSRLSIARRLIEDWYGGRVTEPPGPPVALRQHSETDLALDPRAPAETPGSLDGCREDRKA